MTAQRDRAGEIRGLMLEIRSGLQSIQSLNQTVEEIRNLSSDKDTPEIGNQMGLALCLHHLYTAMEEIFVRINKVFDGVSLSSGNWHKELLRNMSMDIDGVRPRVLSKDLLHHVDEYRAFRHVVRHAYDYELDWLKLKTLLESRQEIISKLKHELEQFQSFLKETIDYLDE